MTDSIREAVKIIYEHLEDRNHHNDCAMLRAGVYGEWFHQHRILEIAKRNEERGYISEKDEKERLHITRMLNPNHE